MLADLFAVIAPIFVCAAIGYLWARSGKPFDTEFASSLSSNIGIPCLIVAIFARLEVEAAAFASMAAATLAVVVATGAVAALGLRLFGKPQSVYFPSLVFGNTGNMGLPLCLFAFGEAGLALAIVFFAVFVTIQFSVGLWVSSGSTSVATLLRTPMLWAALIGVALQFSGIELPRWISNTIGLLGDFAIPLMLLTLGVSLAKLKPVDLAGNVVLSLARLGIGLGLGLAGAAIFGLEGTARGVLILQSAMPAAVLNYLFALRYDTSPEEIAGLVLVSTALSFLTLPLLLLIAMG